MLGIEDDTVLAACGRGDRSTCLIFADNLTVQYCCVVINSQHAVTLCCCGGINDIEFLVSVELHGEGDITGLRGLDDVVAAVLRQRALLVGAAVESGTALQGLTALGVIGTGDVGEAVTCRGCTVGSGNRDTLDEWREFCPRIFCTRCFQCVLAVSTEGNGDIPEVMT